jgi:hypothetical protein
VQPWGPDIQAVYRALRAMTESYPELAVLLLLHMRKPAGKAKGGRSISDVLGEWGRWCDVVLMMENEGTAFERVLLTSRKRVVRQRRIVATKRDFLLVDPVDAETPAGPKVAQDAVLAAIVADPGLTYAELGTRLGVSKDTASRYVKGLGELVAVVGGGPRQSARVYPAEGWTADAGVTDGAAAPQSTAHARAAVDAALGQDEAEVSAAAPHPPYRGAAAAAHLDEADDVDLTDYARLVFDTKPDGRASSSPGHDPEGPPLLWDHFGWASPVDAAA